MVNLDTVSPYDPSPGSFSLSSITALRFHDILFFGNGLGPMFEDSPELI